jgi:carboxymethylenebutenolidase
MVLPLLYFILIFIFKILHSDIEAMKKSLEENEAKHEIVIYKGADHGIFCEERKSFNPEKSEKTWEKFLGFFKS